MRLLKLQVVHLPVATLQQRIGPNRANGANEQQPTRIQAHSIYFPHMHRRPATDRLSRILGQLRRGRLMARSAEAVIEDVDITKRRYEECMVNTDGIGNTTLH